MAMMQAARTTQSLRALSVLSGGACGAAIFQPLQIGANLRGVLVPKVSVFLQTLVDDLFQPRRKIRIQPHGRRGSRVQNGLEDYSRTFSTKRQRTRRHLVQHRSE